MKRAITGIVAASLTLGTMAPAAFAATASAPSYFGSQIHVGSYNTNVQALKVQDAGNTTALFPFYYIQSGLQSIGYTVKWDGVAKRLDITTPDGVSLDTTNLNPGVGDAGIYINGTLVQRAPFSVANDKGGNNKPTSFMAAYYLNQALAHVGFTNAYDGTGAGWTLTAPVAKLGISSVTALNADQIQVVFNSKVDATTAENVDNYSLNTINLDSNHATTGVAAATDATAKLQADGRTVVITGGTTGGFATYLATSVGYVVTVNGVQNAAKSTTLSDVNSNSFTFNGDTTAPSITSVSATAKSSTTQVTIKFSEPVKGVGLYYINGVAANFAQTAPDTLTLTAGSALSGGTSYTLQVVNEKDTSNNLLNTTQSFSVTTDVTAPTITSVQAVGDNDIRVTFSKAMNPLTVIKANLKVLDMATGTDVTAANVGTPTATDSTNTTFDIPFNNVGGSLYNATTNVLPLSVLFTTALQDSLGNALASTSTQNVTLTLDTAAPTISSIKYIQPGATYEGAAVSAHGAIVVTYNKNLASAPTLTAAAGDFVAINNDNGSVDPVATLTGAFGTAGKNEVVFTPSSTLTATTNETFRFNSNIFTSASNGEGKNAAVVETVSVAPAAAGKDSTIPVVGAATGHAAKNAAGDYVDTITFAVSDDDLNYSTVLNTANYRLNGAALAAGTYVTVAAGVATINLPAGAVTTNGNYSLTITGIADQGGNVAPTTVSTVALKDSVVPTLKSATVNADGSVSLTFSQAITTASFTAGDFSITKNGTALASPADYSIAAGVGANAGQVVVTFAAPLVAGDVIAVTTAATPATQDASGNAIAGGTTVSVTK